MTINKQLRDVLGPAIAAARAALRDLEADEIPAKLRPVAKRGDGKLPVPLVRTLLRGIDEDEHFRDLALEAFERRGSDDAVSGAYLRRDDGWWIDVAEAVAAAVSGDRDREIRHLEHERDESRSRADAYRSKLKAAKKELQSAGSAARAKVDERLGPLRAAAADANAGRERAEARVAELQTRIEAVAGEAGQAERVAASLSEQVRRGRRTIAGLLRERDEGTSESFPRDPLELARWLDRTATLAVPYREADLQPGVPATGSGMAGSLLPVGIAPDTVDAIDALAGADGVVVLVDGHNVLGVLDPATLASGRARRRLVTALGRLVRHLGSSTVVVVFDSALEDGRSTVTSDAGVVVQYAPADLIADDVIVDLAAEHGASTVVVSDDREVRERAGTHGATGLWAKALAAWLQPI